MFQFYEQYEAWEAPAIQEQSVAEKDVKGWRLEHWTGEVLIFLLVFLLSSFLSLPVPDSVNTAKRWEDYPQKDSWCSKLFQLK